MATRVSYPMEVKMKAIEMRLAGIPVKDVMEQLNIRNRTQLKTWMRDGSSGKAIDWSSLLVNNIATVKALSMRRKSKN